jgi:hypothetical protein
MDSTSTSTSTRPALHECARSHVLAVSRQCDEAGAVVQPKIVNEALNAANELLALYPLDLDLLNARHNLTLQKYKSTTDGLKIELENARKKCDKINIQCNTMSQRVLDLERHNAELERDLNRGVDALNAMKKRVAELEGKR